MQNAETYRRYAADCMRIAKRMSEADKKILSEIAEAWEMRAAAAERVQAKHQHDGVDRNIKAACLGPVAEP